MQPRPSLLSVTNNQASGAWGGQATLLCCLSAISCCIGTISAKALFEGRTLHVRAAVWFSMLISGHCLCVDICEVVGPPRMKYMM